MGGKSLLGYNSFGIDVWAEHFFSIHSVDQLCEILPGISLPVMVLGGGSNILFTQDPKAFILHNNILGKEIITQSSDKLILKVGGGENWPDFVAWSLHQDLGGLENLSLIPGTVGAAPIQNIGAYGVELKDNFWGLSAIELNTGKERFFSSQECEFAYRDSIFKQAYKGQFFITHVYFKLSRRNHELHTSYGAIQSILTRMNIRKPSIQDVGRAIISIRQSKLPNPKKLGNAGSFFKNPVIDSPNFSTLKKRFPDLVFYPLPNGQYKIPAGWLIDQCGWRGKKIGPVGCYEKQALVLVNYGGASGRQVVDLAERIIDSVLQTFGIELEPEVNVL